MVVQFILNVRMGEREVISDDEDEESAAKPKPEGEKQGTTTEEPKADEPETIKPSEEPSSAAPEESAKEEPSAAPAEPQEKMEAVDNTSNGEKLNEVKETKDAPETTTPSKNVTFAESPRKKNNKTTPAKKIQVEEFFVKYKNFSYLHCEWRTEEELLKGDKRIQGKIKRFRQKRNASMNIMDFLEEESFNPDYIEVDRILDISQTPDDTGKMVTHYLVKWKALPYEDATWELEDDVDIARVEAYKQYKDPPPRNERKTRKRPGPDEWKKLEQSPIYKNDNTLREYQLEGLNWLNFSYHNNHNCILADEMGLGKTIQSLSFVDAVYKTGIRGPFLIIAPLSTIPNWQREFEGWTDLNIVVYHGSQASRNMILEYEMYYKDDKGQRIPGVYKFNVLITTFEVIISDCVDLKDINWRVCIIDEAHRLKNRVSNIIFCVYMGLLSNVWFIIAIDS